MIVLVLQDESLGLIEIKQREAGLARAGVQLGATRFDDVARAFGGHGATVTTIEALADELHAALARPAFSLIACPVKVADYAGSF